MKKISKISTLILINITYYFFSVATVSAAILQNSADINKNVNQLNNGAQYNSGSGLGDIAQIVIQAFLSLLGIIFITLVIQAGYYWMTAGGEEAKVQKAKDTLWRAIIGIIITVGAYAITYFVFKYLGGLGGPNIG